MLAIAKALLRIASNLEKIRTILEIVFADKLEYYKLSQEYYKTKRNKEKDSDREFVAKEPILIDEFGYDIIEKEEI